MSAGLLIRRRLDILAWNPSLGVPFYESHDRLTNMCSVWPFYSLRPDERETSIVRHLFLPLGALTN
jgi:hypothetical protein